MPPLTLTFEPKINRDHLLVMTNQHVKYKHSVMNGIKDNQRKSFGLPTDRQTDISKTIYPLFFEGGHKNIGQYIYNGIFKGGHKNIGQYIYNGIPMCFK